MNACVRRSLGVWALVAAIFYAFCSASFASTNSSEISLGASALTFGSVNLNTQSPPQSFTVTNTGTQKFVVQSVMSSSTQFLVTGPSLPKSLAPGQSASFQVVFAPTVAGALSGSITVSVNHVSQKTCSITVSGTGLPTQAPPTSTQPPTPSTYLLSPAITSLNLASVLVGATASQSVILTNTGNSSVTISQLGVTGSGFAAAGLSIPLILPAGQSTTLTVSFSPLTPGTVTGAVSVASTATNSPTAIALTGAGVQPQLNVVPNPVAFGNDSVSVSSTQTVTIRNTGTAILTVNQATVSGQGFGLGALALPLSIAPSGSASLTVSFTPASASNFSGTLSLSSNAPGPPLSVPLSGSGVHSVNLAWSDPSSSGTLAGFNVYRSLVTGGPYSKVNSSLIPTSAFTDSSVQSGTTYYYVTTAVNASGAETPYSNEAAAAIP